MAHAEGNFFRHCEGDYTGLGGTTLVREIPSTDSIAKSGVMSVVKFLKFYWTCLKEAGRGSVIFANAWQGIWGLLALWAFGYWRGGPVMIPDKVDEYALVFLLASLGTTWLGIFVFQLVAAPAKFYWAQWERAERLDQDLTAAVASKSELVDEGPNWPIHEVFSHLEPDVLNPAHERWETVANELRDALSLGRLRIWGRLYKTELGEWIGERAALRPIDKTYWYKAFFTYLFFDETAGKAAHCYADRTNGVPLIQICRLIAAKFKNYGLES